MDPDEDVVVATVSDCPPGDCIEVVAAGRMVALCNVDGQFFALDGICPHQGGPLGKGKLCGHIVTCPWHGWQFDVRHGENQITPAVRQPTFAVRLDGDRVIVRRQELEES
jgi:nitrite reductase (NADH) small subunit